MPTEEHHHGNVNPEVFNAIVEISEDAGIFTNGAAPKTAPPKAEVSRKPPGSSIAPSGLAPDNQ